MTMMIIEVKLIGMFILQMDFNVDTTSSSGSTDELQNVREREKDIRPFEKQLLQLNKRISKQSSSVNHIE